MWLYKIFLAIELIVFITKPFHGTSRFYFKFTSFNYQSSRSHIKYSHNRDEAIRFFYKKDLIEQSRLCVRSIIYPREFNGYS